MSCNKNRYTLQDYIQSFPKFKKWINECRLCHKVGYNPEMPDHIGGEFSIGANQIKKYGSPLMLNGDGICDICEKLIKKKNSEK